MLAGTQNNFRLAPPSTGRTIAGLFGQALSSTPCSYHPPPVMRASTPSVLARPIRTVRTRRRCGAQDFDDCSEKRVRARELVLENRNKGNRTVTASLDGEIRDGRHQMQVRVYFEDTDSGQIVYHANFLRFMERGRTNYLRLLGTSQHALLQEAQNDAPGVTFVVRSMTIDFLKPAILDDVLDVVTLPQEVRGASITLLQECRRAEDLLVTARVRVAFISGGKAQRIPKALRLAMEGHK